MDILTIIEEYIGLKIRKDNLNSSINSETRGQYYAKVEGDIAFNDGNYAREMGYNASARSYAQKIEEAKRDLEQIERLIEFTNQSYVTMVSSMTSSQLSETASIVSFRKYEIQRQIQQISERRTWAKQKGDEAFANHQLQEELEYNRISSECYITLNELEAKARGYQSIIDDLTRRSGKDFTGPHL